MSYLKYILLFICAGLSLRSTGQELEHYLQDLPCLLGREYQTDEVFGYLQDDRVSWKAAGANEEEGRQEVWGWYFENEQFSGSCRNGRKLIDGERLRVIHEVTLVANSPEESVKLFGKYISKWGLNSNYRKDKKWIKRNYSYYSGYKRKSHHAFKFLDQDKVYVSMEWDRSNKKKPWLREVRWQSFDGAGYDCELNYRPKENPFSDLVYFDVQDEATYWRLLGRELTDQEIRYLHLYGDCVIVHSRFEGSTGSAYLFFKGCVFFKDCETPPTVNSIFYVINDGEEITPFGPSSQFLDKHLDDYFGQPYAPNNYHYYIHAAHPEYASSSWVKIDFNFTTGDRGTPRGINFSLDDSEHMDWLVEQRWENILPDVGCIFGNCTNGTGIHRYPDGYRMIGDFENGKPVFAIVKDYRDTTITVIDNRPKVEKVDPNEGKRVIYGSLKSYEGKINSMKDRYLGFMRASEKMYHAKTADERMAELTASRNYLTRLFEDCAAFTKECERTKDLIYKHRICNSLTYDINKMMDLVKEVNSLTSTVSMGTWNLASFDDFKKYIDPKGAEMKQLIADMHALRKSIYQEFNDCGNN
ncbi:MAG: hypothetical protein H6608_03370 [Flavobacteriales bacterium]|nr:hypothetical protein [Bacteroidota bacterium]MCB9240145.1 hypothetical protein [Flavobacteriales bacterium]